MGVNSLGAEYKFQHYRSLDPRDTTSPKEMIWASTVGEIDPVRQGSKEELDVLREQTWLHNFLTDQGEAAMLETFFRNNHIPAFHFALYNATPTETSTMTLTTEVTGTGYARIALARDTVGWGAPALDVGDYRTVSATKTFTASGTWTSATHLALVSSLSGTTGTLYAIVALSATRTLNNGDTLNTSMAVKLA